VDVNSFVVAWPESSAAEVMLLGSTTDQVLRRAAGPVLVVPAAPVDSR
jgi:nucleotide-binding universal stress UspA family protein